MPRRFCGGTDGTSDDRATLMANLLCDEREPVPDGTTPALEKPKRRIHLHVKTYILIFVMVLLNPVSNILLKKGMDQVGPMVSWAPTNVATFFVHAFTTGTIWLAITCLMGFFVAYLLVLSWADYTFVQPSAALSNGLTALLALLVLHEFISPIRWVGILLICSGVFVVGHTHPQTTEQN
jgi:drug/metabolite transporter (DMT)-like permease